MQREDFFSQEEIFIDLERILSFLSDRSCMQRVSRPKGGLINVYLRWLPVPFHKQLDCLLRHIQSDWRRFPLPSVVTRYLTDASQTSSDPRPPMPRGEYGLRALMLDDRPVPEADAARIAALAKEDVDRYLSILYTEIYLL